MNELITEYINKLSSKIIGVAIKVIIAPGRGSFCAIVHRKDAESAKGK